MGVLLDRCGPWAIARAGLVAVQADLVRRLSQLRVIFRAMHVVAIEAGNSAAIHYALREIVTLHAVLVCGSIREVSEGCLTEGVIFELPVIGKVKAYVITDGPIVRFSLDLLGERLPLGVALNAGVI